MLCFLLSLPASASEPWDLTGSSLRDQAMAGAGAAGSVPGSAIPIDPAGVTSVDGELLQVSWHRTAPDVRLDREGLLTESIDAVDLSIAAGAPLRSLRIGGGFDLYLPLPMAVDTVVHVDQTSAQAPMLEDAWDFMAFDAAGGIGWGPVDVALGAAVGMDLLADTTAVVEDISGGEATDEGLELQEGIDVTLDRQIVWQIAPMVGAHLRHDDLDAYLSWRGPLGMRSYGDNDLEFNVNFFGITLDPVDLELDYLSGWSPARLAGGVSWDFGRVRPELGARYMWSSAWRDSQNQEPETPFVDVLQLAGGVEGDLWKGLVLRAGYARHPSPVPDQVGDSRIADADRNLFAGGLAWSSEGLPREGDASELALSVQYHRLSERPVADSRISGRIWVVSAGVATEF